MFFFDFEDAFEYFPGNVVFYLLAVSNRLSQRRDGLVFQFYIAVKNFFWIFADHHYAQVL